MFLPVIPTRLYGPKPRRTQNISCRISGSRTGDYEEYCLLGHNATCFHAGILHGLFYPDDRGDRFLRNVG
jgi:hypothetical protein